MARPIYDLLQIGQNVLIKGKRGYYEVGSALSKQSVFKARIQGTHIPVMIKTDDQSGFFEQEADAYEFDCVRRSQYIRALREVVDNGTDRCMVFEWMDHDLWSLRKRDDSFRLSLLKVLASSVLKALCAFSDMDGQGPVVHVDVNPNNILVSGADTPSPVVKLADLGGSKDFTVIASGESWESRPQGFAIRAPEIWKGHPPTPACDVWSVGVSLVHFILARALLGPSDMNIRLPSKSHETTQAAWSIGKISRLLGTITRDEDPKFTEEFNLADLLVRMSLTKAGLLKEELARFNVTEDCIGFIQYLLTIDPKERPTPEKALRHPWLQTAVSEEN